MRMLGPGRRRIGKLFFFLFLSTAPIVTVPRTPGSLGTKAIRYQNVTVYFSMQKWEYLEGHNGLYKDLMMENHQTLMSWDGSSNRNTPERCPHPIYSLDCTESNHIPQDYQGDNLTDIKAEDIEGEEETYVRGDQQEIPTDIRTDGSSNRNTPERCPRPLYSQDFTEENHRIPQECQIGDLTDIKVEVTEGEEEMYVMGDQQCKEEEIPTDISADGSRNRKTPERCPRPLYSQDCTEENYSIPQECQVDDLTVIKVEHIDEEEEMYVRGDQQCKEEEIPTDISTDGHGTWNSLEGYLILSPGYKIEDNIIQVFPGGNPITPNIHQLRHSAHISSDHSSHEACFPNNSDIAIPSTAHRGDTILPCSECGKCFTIKSSLVKHQRIHKGDKPFPCSECGKCFTDKSSLVKHQRIHTGEKPYPCSECGKCFTDKSNLLKHQRIHTGENPFPCSECGKCFTVKSNLLKHQRVHAGEKPYPCSECGKCFAQKSHLVTHQRIHSGEKPFPCSECGRCFPNSINLDRHYRTHTGEKPYPCSECGKCFSVKYRLVNHQRIHSGEKPFPCSECGKCFTDKSNLLKHQRIHNGV
ncbi:uncharacterized protein LOC142159853 isoform X2 [Mixophyes fleayi]|uniref:uncharacterized protein LOC142159853 isoform X2 n=1 Tax=Mixophyes fleayi TaxID=3061075 RepID=UPI003F4D7987